MSNPQDILDYTKAHEVAAFKHDRPLTTCRFDSSGRYVFVAAQDAGLHRFDLDDGTKVSFLGGHDAWIRAIGFDADGAIIGELTGHERDVYSAEIHPGGEFLLTGDLMGSLRQWNLASRKEVRALDATALRSYNGGQQVDFGGVRGIDVSPDLKYLAAGGLHNASNPLGSVHEPLVRLFEWDDPEKVISQVATDIPGGVVWRLRYLADGTLMGASGGTTGGFLLFWKAGEEKTTHQHKLPNMTRDMDLAPDRRRVANAHADGHVRITRLTPKAG